MRYNEKKQDKYRSKESKSVSITVENAYRVNKETIKTNLVYKEIIVITVNDAGSLPEIGYLRGCRLYTHYVMKYYDF